MWRRCLELAAGEVTDARHQPLQEAAAPLRWRPSWVRPQPPPATQQATVVAPPARRVLKMSTEVSNAIVSPSAKTYSECSVQTDIPSPRVIPVSLSTPRRLDMSFDDPANASILFSDLGSPSSGAYTQSSPRPATVQPQRLAKPRLEPSRPTNLGADPNRIVSMPETTPVFQVKRELKHSARVVSMPSQPGKPVVDALADLSMSSEGASGNSSSLYTGTSLASISESDTSGTLVRCGY